MENTSRLSILAKRFDRQEFKTLRQKMSLAEYLELLYEQPKLARTAYQRLYDMIMSKGITKFKRYRKTYTHYNFFDDAQIPIFGLDDTLEELVKFIRGAAGGYGTEKRFLLLHGPVGSSKSTILRLFKRGLERYSKTNEGSWYSYEWINLPTGLEDALYVKEIENSPMNEDPIKLLPPDIRQHLMADLNEILQEQTPESDRINMYTLKSTEDLNPRCKFFMNELLNRYEGDWEKVVEKHIRVVRRVYSEADRCGIATFQPKDEKNQDATELTGDINYAKLSHFGSDADPRAFEFSGEFCVGNRGIVEFIEVLKLAKEFLYDLLGASQEQQIKPKKFPQVPVDEVLIGHTNTPEYIKLKGDATMEALRDRTVKIDVPYQLRHSIEQKILEHSYNPSKVRQHIAPHTIEIAALWAVLTRLKEDKNGKLNLVEKAKVYDGKSLPGVTEDTVKEMREIALDEGMTGISPRYVQDKISNCLSSNHDYINPFMVLNELREGLASHSLIANEEDLGKYMACYEMAYKELEEILKAEVQKALVGDEEAIIRLCANYVDNMMAYIQKEKVFNTYTGQDHEPDERLMRSIEEKINIPEIGANDFRRSLAGFIGHLSHNDKKFTWDSNPQLKKALEKKLFEDTKDHIKLSALNIQGASVVDPDIQEKIDALKKRLISQYGYNEKSATDVLNHVGSIFARGDIVED